MRWCFHRWCDLRSCAQTIQPGVSSPPCDSWLLRRRAGPFASLCCVAPLAASQTRRQRSVRRGAVSGVRGRTAIGAHHVGFTSCDLLLDQVVAPSLALVPTVGLGSGAEHGSRRQRPALVLPTLPASTADASGTPQRPAHIGEVGTEWQHTLLFCLGHLTLILKLGEEKLRNCWKTRAPRRSAPHLC